MNSTPSNKQLIIALMAVLTKYKFTLLLFVLIVLHLVGLIGMANDRFFDFFASLSWLNLILTFVLFILSYEKIDNKLWGFFVLCFFTGMTFEWIGVHTGIVFGEYTYGHHLGWKVFGVPVTIGLNWILLTVSSANIAHSFLKNTFLKACFGAFLMVFLDYFIEQVAQILDFWQWKDEQIPIFNYITWFVIGFVLQFIYFKLNAFKANLFSHFLFIVLTLFFIIINLIL